MSAFTSTDPFLASHPPPLCLPHLHSHQSSEADWSSFSFGFPGVFGFSDTKASYIAKSLLKEHNRTLYFSQREFTEFTVSVKGHSSVTDANLDPRFKAAQAGLPLARSTPEDVAAYGQFITYFGDAVATTASYGGQLQYFVAVNQSLFESHTEEWVYHQVGLWVAYEDWMLGIGSSSNHSHETNSREFLWNSTNITRIVGGSSNSSYSAFSHTVRGNPALVRPTFEDMDRFITDPTKRGLMADAVREFRKAGKKPTKPKSLGAPTYIGCRCSGGKCPGGCLNGVCYCLYAGFGCECGGAPPQMRCCP